MREFLSSPVFREISGIRWNLGEFGEIREISGKFRGTQWNSVGFCMALSMNSVGIPGGFRGDAGFLGKFGVWGGFGRFGASKGFCANNQGDTLLANDCSPLPKWFIQRPESQNALLVDSVPGFGAPGKANLPRILGRH